MSKWDLGILLRDAWTLGFEPTLQNMIKHEVQNSERERKRYCLIQYLLSSLRWYFEFSICLLCDNDIVSVDISCCKLLHCSYGFSFFLRESGQLSLLIMLWCNLKVLAHHPNKHQHWASMPDPSVVVGCCRGRFSHWRTCQIGVGQRRPTF